MPPVQFVPMTEDEFQVFLKDSITDYAQDLARAGNVSSEQALESSEKQFMELLPNGLASPDQHLYTICDRTTREKVGYIWVAIIERGGRKLAFIYDLLIFSNFRRQGYGEQAMLALEDKIIELGSDEIRLHVFGHNPGARALYQKIGYVETNINMAKRLEKKE